MGSTWQLGCRKTIAQFITDLRLTKERTDGKAFHKRMKPVLNRRCPAENGRLSVDGNGVLLAVTLDGNLATRFFAYSVPTGMNALWGGPYADCSIAKSKDETALNAVWVSR